MEKKVELKSLYGKVKYQLQYVDYQENQWTAPVMLTEERANKFCDDLSVKKVKIITDTEEWILDVK